MKFRNSDLEWTIEQHPEKKTYRNYLHGVWRVEHKGRQGASIFRGWENRNGEGYEAFGLDTALELAERMIEEEKEVESLFDDMFVITEFDENVLEVMTTEALQEVVTVCENILKARKT